MGGSRPHGIGFKHEDCCHHLVGPGGLVELCGGAAKIAQTPQEVQFFSALGLNAFWLYPLGILQVGGPVACAISSARAYGLLAIALGFTISSVMIFMTGKAVFGLVSLVPVAIALWLSRRP